MNPGNIDLERCLAGRAGDPVSAQHLRAERHFE
ncbi:hypothetical protein FHR38_004731 [Micromonospora polyrhachis]|uniref:Uncharacterized protein n=1 Tax=Micromonospora polyrhachis TaxID=1282883 RepID=A0A7W7SU89_9ACTN|nr:hypothetical protein [Micromonospora polyrhachis]